MVKIFREVKQYAKKNKKKIEKQLIVDTVATTIFWFVVHGLKDVFIVRLTMEQVFLAGVSGAILNLVLGGVYGQVLNLARKWFKCQ